MPADPPTAPTGASPTGGRAWRWLRRLVLFGVLAGVLTVLGSIGWTRLTAAGHLYDVAQVPEAPVALVLGAQVFDDGRPSGFLEARLALAKQLYDAGKVRAILVSGDNGRATYDEPSGMRDWLIAHGVPGNRVIADYAGFDTYDSCQRAIRIFGVDRLTVITQSYHIARAVTLCRQAGIDANGVFDDTARQYPGYWAKAVVREQGACVKALLDVLLGRDPIFLGPHETSVENALRQ